ncbi:hypothetical protein HBI56_046330 [Parastagonospora nodorum]|uniref:Uncharacterized protein n=1 Tax=Phaeosphaeria nodorum (strain SN15 / ATCC MYA-4574 / FGSC 10173) TaxID=321614 RepID=A0A7U2ERM3_PHANO|nr:hypothetical protein HBH56_059470 [Parastagonospora nodorum]QRC91810.1 hypothetical protein JI435_401710 [Parastagonospora nodorum SN15]KAH3931054.1 hypothetical protein HBH54_103400 [Parastagonospora nodorum]KAH3943911.1 hypothetical protein HBH53_165890 [Parastagonospora nodorum]KAH3965487.1 hypothetical protein HBH51_152140 [Parastagonospora nodorum]
MRNSCGSPASSSRVLLWGQRPPHRGSLKTAYSTLAVAKIQAFLLCQSSILRPQYLFFSSSPSRTPCMPCRLCCRASRHHREIRAPTRQTPVDVTTHTSLSPR